ncbi:MAG TPA: hypothetical protein VFR23_24555 [Jiangellaceae bacterium]|nr:hypothetical protein [Jiangellaceae bacterium]
MPESAPESPPSVPPIVVEAEVLYESNERPTDARIREINGPGPLPPYPPPSLRHAGKAPSRSISPPPGSWRSQVVDAIAGDDRRSKARARLFLGAAMFLVFGGGAGAAKLWGRAWLDVPSVAEWKAADDAKAKSLTELAEQVSDLRQKEAARATEEERRRDKDKLRVLEEQNRALQDEVRRAYSKNPGRAPVVMPPAEP